MAGFEPTDDIGSSSQVDFLLVRWPSGILDTFQNVPANQRITIVEGGGIVGVQATPPVEAFLVQARPSPFRHETEILLSGPRSGPATLKIFDVQGRLVRSLKGELPGSIRWDARDAHGRAVPRGVYFYRLMAGGAIATGKVVQIR